MGRKSHRYRPAHSAHGTVYWNLFMWPFVMRRALKRAVGGGKRSLGFKPPWKDTPPTRAAPPPGRRLPPPPPPPAAAA
jgi:hypothetical protein